jgi:cobalamin transport system substrate-binding protein
MKYFKRALILTFAIFAISVFGKNDEKLRVVSISPCLTELIFHLGEDDKLVGRSSACDYPEKAKKIESVGGFGKPSLEKLITLKPDVVIASALADPAIKTSIEQFGIKFYLLPTKSIDDYYMTVATMGKILDCREKADTEIARIRQGLAKFAKIDKNSRVPQKKIYLEIWDRPYMTIGKKSFINDLIEYAGGKNIASQQNEDYFNTSVEWIITSNPDIIICPAMKTGREADVKNRKGWGNISAIKNKRIYVDLNDDLIYRLGPRVLEGVELLRKIIQK